MLDSAANPANVEPSIALSPIYYNKKKQIK